MRAKRNFSVRFLFFFLQIFSLVNLYGQTNSYTDNTKYNYRPQISSPNAAILEKFVEFPAANYTGVPDISIPIYQIDAKSVTIPIGISYHAGGIKVDEVASNVGLGWALNAGGVISIMTNRILDEKSGFPLIDSTIYSKIKNLSFQSSYQGPIISCWTALLYEEPWPLGPDPYGLYSGGDIAYLWDVIRDVQDSEPDLYTFNFLGRSGKFFQDPTGVFRTIPYSELKIERITENYLPAGYRITDEKGNIYEFKVREESQESSYNWCNPPWQNDETISRSYYLSKIITFTGEVINFYYTQHLYSYSLQKHFSRARTSPLTDCWQFNNYGEYRFYCETTKYFEIGGQRLDSIKTSSNTLVKFDYSAINRKDVSGTAHALKKIEVWSLFDGIKLREFKFNHSYFGDSTSANTDLCRLKLTGFEEEGKPAYEFVYNTTISMPARLSYSQDHFGFYNERSNSTLLPDDEYRDFYNGADRSVDTAFIQAGMLTKIIHPTGGRTEYTYESNEFWVPDTTIIYPKITGPYLVSYPDSTVSTNFTLPSNAVRVKIFHSNSFDGTQIHNDYCYINLYGPNNYFRQFVGDEFYPGIDIELVPGNYTLEIENVGSTYSADATIFWFEETQVPPHNELGGGVRIKKIEKYDADNTLALVKKYEYKQDTSIRSSGKKIFSITYNEYKDEVIYKQDGGANQSCSSTPCSYIVQNSTSITPLGFANGSFVLYSEVTTFLKDKTENGYSHTKYLVSANEFSSIPSFPYPPRIAYDWMNGNILEQKEYGYINNQFRLLKKTKNTYNYIDFNKDDTTQFRYTTYGARIAPETAPFICFSFCYYGDFTTVGNISFGIQRYQYYSSFHRLDKTEDTVYETSGNNYLATVTNYYYDSSLSIEPCRVETVNSRGETIIQNAKYSQDYNSYGFIQALLNKNVRSAPIEKLTIKKDAGNNKFVLNGEIITYKTGTLFIDKVFSLDVNMPIAIGSFTPSNMNSSGVFSKDSRYSEKASINGYDAFGNIREVQKISDIKYCYIWDYNFQYPIAEITNADTLSIAYTSFEADGKGGWSFSGAVSADNTAPTGKKVYNLSGGNITKNTPAGVYLVSYWSKSGSPYSVNGSSSPTRTGKTIDGWTYYEHKIILEEPVILTISGSNYIDEVRLFPADALMTTYTYTPLIGMTSQCDAQNRITYYEYDSFGRLKLIKDQDKNIIKVFDYKYQQTQNQ